MANPLLPFPSEQQQQQQQDEPPQLLLHPAPLLPLASLPGAYVTALSAAVGYWRVVQLSHSRIESNPPAGRLDELTVLADAVLAALRGEGNCATATLLCWRYVGLLQLVLTVLGGADCAG
jgi:hypothetical protein